MTGALGPSGLLLVTAMGVRSTIRRGIRSCSKTSNNRCGYVRGFAAFWVELQRRRIHYLLLQRVSANPLRGQGKLYQFEVCGCYVRSKGGPDTSSCVRPPWWIDNRYQRHYRVLSPHVGDLRRQTPDMNVRRLYIYIAFIATTG